MRVLVLQHISCEPPGVYEKVLRERGAVIDRVELDDGERLPDWRAYDLIVAMGGPRHGRVLSTESSPPFLAQNGRLDR